MILFLNFNRFNWLIKYFYNRSKSNRPKPPLKKNNPKNSLKICLTRTPIELGLGIPSLKYSRGLKESGFGHGNCSPTLYRAQTWTPITCTLSVDVTFLAPLMLGVHPNMLGSRQHTYTHFSSLMSLSSILVREFIGTLRESLIILYWSNKYYFK
jgi:hypothetical protein